MHIVNCARRVCNRFTRCAGFPKIAKLVNPSHVNSVSSMGEEIGRGGVQTPPLRTFGEDAKVQTQDNCKGTSILQPWTYKQIRVRSA